MGTLSIVATPIGNLKDITLWAIEILNSVDYIACEDKRVTGKLLNHLGIQKKMLAINDFNEQEKTPQIVSILLNGQNIALVSDAGTPLVSDPGFKLVRESVKAGIKVESIPGVSALISALVISGMPCDKFTFIGYLPKKDGKKMQLLNDIKKSRECLKSTVILYESPFRVLKTLNSVKDAFGDIEVVICRELTKIHEEVMRGKLTDILGRKMTLKGEFVLIF